MKNLVVGVTSRHRNIESETGFGHVAGVRHVFETLYPQGTGLLKRFLPNVSKFGTSLGLARVQNGSMLLHSRQKVLLNRSPWVVSYDALMPFWPKPYFSKSLYRQVTAVLASELCRAVLPYSQSAKRLLEIRNADHGRLDSILQRCRVILPGVDDYPVAFQANISRDLSRQIHILFVGTQFFIKGGHLLVNAYGRIRNQYPVRLTVVSSLSTDDWTTKRDPKLAVEYKAKISEWGVAHFQYLNNRQIRELMGTADILAMPSIDETFGLVFLEALASGIPVVGSSIRAMPEIINHGLTGLRVPHECTEEGLMVRYPGFEEDLEKGIEAALRALLDDPDGLKRMKFAARNDYLERFTMERLARELGEVYSRAMD